MHFIWPRNLVLLAAKLNPGTCDLCLLLWFYFCFSLEVETRQRYEPMYTDSWTHLNQSRNLIWLATQLKTTSLTQYNHCPHTYWPVIMPTMPPSFRQDPSIILKTLRNTNGIELHMDLVVSRLPLLLKFCQVLRNIHLLDEIMERSFTQVVFDVTCCKAWGSTTNGFLSLFVVSFDNGCDSGEVI